MVSLSNFSSIVVAVVFRRLRGSMMMRATTAGLIVWTMSIVLLHNNNNDPTTTVSFFSFPKVTAFSSSSVSTNPAVRRSNSMMTTRTPSWASTSTLVVLSAEKEVTAGTFNRAEDDPIVADLILTRKVEDVVKLYFRGVQEKNETMILSCFDEEDDEVSIRDVCNVNGRPGDVAGEVVVSASAMAKRCMDFVRAHPDCEIGFHYGPSRSHRSSLVEDENFKDSGINRRLWIMVHWYETGTWTGESCGIVPSPPSESNNFNKMSCEGQTRFLVNENTMKIEKLVVTRTFTEWETALLEKQRKEEEQQSSQFD